MHQVQHKPRAFTLNLDRTYLLMIEGKHLLIKPKGPGTARLIVDGCGPVSPSFNVTGYCNPLSADVTAKLVQGTMEIPSPSNPEPAANFDFQFNDVPAGTYLLIVEGCCPQEECEVVVEAPAETVPDLQMPDGR